MPLLQVVAADLKAYMSDLQGYDFTQTVVCTGVGDGGGGQKGPDANCALCAMTVRCCCMPQLPIGLTFNDQPAPARL